jgi:hypothetical protein
MLFRHLFAAELNLPKTKKHTQKINLAAESHDEFKRVSLEHRELIDIGGLAHQVLRKHPDCFFCTKPHILEGPEGCASEKNREC